MAPQVRWLRPLSLNQLLTMKQAFPHARLVGGNTEVGIEMRATPEVCAVVIAPTHVPELTEVPRALLVEILRSRGSQCCGQASQRYGEP